MNIMTRQTISLKLQNDIIYEYVTNEFPKGVKARATLRLKMWVYERISLVQYKIQQFALHSVPAYGHANCIWLK